MDDALCTIGEMCTRFEVTPRTLRFYEAKELLFPIREGTKRLFTKRDRARLKLILQGKRFGFALEDIRQLLNLYDIDDQQVTQMGQVYALGVERMHAMQAQRDELTEAIGDLKGKLSWAEQFLASRGVNIARQ